MAGVPDRYAGVLGQMLQWIRCISTGSGGGGFDSGVLVGLSQGFQAPGRHVSLSFVASRAYG